MQYKLSTRFILANGSYITANKKFILTEKKPCAKLYMR
ncbi:MAG: DUF5776 domain-containing protein [Lentilactobacillus buchneri]|nr:DUF5776 domain-containing protein [Lentilactobacillus buchneri]